MNSRSRRAFKIANVAQLAATAFTHGLTLVTGNVRDFTFAGLAVFNPSAK
jgi:predicted nucleic acid-binding protein